MTIHEALELVAQHIDNMSNGPTRKALTIAEDALESMSTLSSIKACADCHYQPCAKHDII